MTARVRTFLVLFLFVLALGCSGDKRGSTGRLKGKLTYKNQQVTLANMYFVSEDSGGMPATVTEQGYSVVGLKPGQYDVTVETETFNPAKKQGADAYSRGVQDRSKMMSPTPPGSGAVEQKGTYVQIPAKYANKDTTTLKLTVESGSHTKDIELTD
jgi:hypothetical protein